MITNDNSLADCCVLVALIICKYKENYKNAIMIRLTTHHVRKNMQYRWNINHSIIFTLAVDCRNCHLVWSAFASYWSYTKFMQWYVYQYGIAKNTILSGFVTNHPGCVWCRGSTTCLLYLAQFFGKSIHLVCKVDIVETSFSLFCIEIFRGLCGFCIRVILGLFRCQCGNPIRSPL